MVSSSARATPSGSGLAGVAGLACGVVELVLTAGLGRRAGAALVVRVVALAGA